MSQLAFWAAQPPCQARWAPMLLEPVIGTGERITVAIAIDYGTGIEVIPALRPVFIHAAFGDSAADFKSLLTLLKQSVERSQITESTLNEWEQPFDGLTIGEFSSAAGSSRQDIVDTVLSISSSFHATRSYGAKRDSAYDSHKTRVLESAIKEHLVRVHPTSRDFFGRAIPGTVERNVRRLGFFDDFYAAQFGVLSGGSSFGTTKQHAKSKLWDLERLRDTPRLFRDSLALEFIGKPTGAGHASKNSIEDLQGQLAEEAAAADIEFVVVANSREAAQRVLNRSVLAA